MRKNHLPFLLSLWKANLLAAMEFRASFITQSLGMILNDAAYFAVWIIFFDRFKDVNGWGMRDMGIIFGIAAAAFGLGVMLFGNAPLLSDIIAKGQLDYYLSLPRPPLLHALASRSTASGIGDLLYGVLSFLVFSRPLTWDSILRFVVGVLLAGIVFIAFLVLVHSLTFWVGNAAYLGGLALNAIITFAIYPITLFQGSAKFILFTLIPAALIGAVPAAFAAQFNWFTLFQLAGGALLFALLAVGTFQLGLRRYESGSAINVNA
ncbi:MAG: ABC-2 family transporter protein [Anaerolineales bacterium]